MTEDTTTHSNDQRVLIIGATSGIARAVARRFAQLGHPLVLAGRDIDEISTDAEDLRIRYGVEVKCRAFDALDFDSHPALVEDLDFSSVVLCHGIMLSNEEARASVHEHRRMIDVNFTSYASLLEIMAAYFEARGEGVIAALSSVAGDRGRSSNYCYAATKAAVTAYLSGFRSRLRPKGISVLTVKPGPTDTPMTQGLEIKGSTASAELVANQIVRDMLRRRSVCYTPRRWWFIMKIIGAIPEWIFKRLRF